MWAAVAPPDTMISVALARLGAGDLSSYREIMGPCEAFGRVVFEEPTRHYKAGLAFLAYLNGHQDNFMLVNHAERGRETAHLCRVTRAAAACGAIRDAALASQRIEAWSASMHS